MPLPTPNSGETHDHFMQRCMANPTMREEFPNPSQRAAVCENQWSSNRAAYLDHVRAIVRQSVTIALGEGRKQKQPPEQ